MGAQNRAEIDARRYKAGNNVLFPGTGMTPAERKAYEEKQKTQTQLESLQSGLKDLQDQFGKFNQPTGSNSFTASRPNYSVAGTLGNQANLRISSNEPRASRVRRRNRAM